MSTNARRADRLTIIEVLELCKDQLPTRCRLPPARGIGGGRRGGRGGAGWARWSERSCRPGGAGGSRARALTSFSSRSGSPEPAVPARRRPGRLPLNEIGGIARSGWAGSGFRR